MKGSLKRQGHVVSTGANAEPGQQGQTLWVPTSQENTGQLLQLRMQLQQKQQGQKEGRDLREVNRSQPRRAHGPEAPSNARCHPGEESELRTLEKQNNLEP